MFFVLQSELTLIQSLDRGCVEDEFPGRCCVCRFRLILSVLEIKWSIQLFQFSYAFFLCVR
jgi:hypothetical protein